MDLCSLREVVSWCSELRDMLLNPLIFGNAECVTSANSSQERRGWRIDKSCYRKGGADMRLPLGGLFRWTLLLTFNSLTIRALIK